MHGIKNGWQPIETAPKDGTSILAYCEEGETPFVAHWGYVGRYTSSVEGWLGHEAGYVSTGDIIGWQPLPKSD